MKNTQLPVFVYGTLMTGYGNHMAFLDQQYVNYHPKATLRGFSMFSLGGFPMIFRSSSQEDTVQGQVFYINPDRYVEVMHDLDRLEGEGHFYFRSPVSVQVVEDGVEQEITAWVYHGAEGRNHDFAPVPTGDWRSYRSSHRRY